MLNGLTKEEVKTRIKNGEDNKIDSEATKLIDIFKKHIFTFFNIINFILALLVFIFGRRRDAMFFIIAVFATIIAIINDVRAKFSLDKLNILSIKPFTVIRDGRETQISPEKIVKNDIIKFSIGDQIIVDAEIKNGEIEVNESFVTGESNTIKKTLGDTLISGSFVVSGACYAEVKAVGKENYISKLLTSTKKINTTKSKLFLTIQNIIKVNSITIIPVGLLLFVKQYFIDYSINSAITSTVAAIVSMIPEGLILLTSSVLALATIRLSKKKVLINNFYSIETLARIDTICLDKTGTLTTGNMKVEKIIEISKNSKQEIEQIIKISNTVLPNSNQTSNALLAYFGKTSKTKVDEIYQFSSERKCSGYKIKDTKYLLGAYDFVTKDTKYKKIETEYSRNYRVLTVLKQGTTEEILGFILLSDEIRQNAKELLEYYQNNNVKIKIISGDNLGTIEKILSTLNFKNNKALDFSKIKSNKSYRKVVEEYDIFARVTPEEKKKIIAALQKNGHCVAMTGDGVNDVLALKEASCGISIGCAADAARRTADIVLLNNDFSTLPNAINEGRQTINNVTRSSALFLNKTIFATILSITYIFLNFRYPFSPIEMSFINFCIIGAPSFLLALEKNYNKPETNFIKHIIKNSAPSAIATILSIITLSIISSYLKLTWEQTTQLSCLTTCLIGIILIIKISYPLNKFRISILLPLIAIIFLSFVTPFAEKVLYLGKFSISQLMIFLILSAFAAIIFSISIILTNKIERITRNKLKNRSKILQFHQ